MVCKGKKCYSCFTDFMCLSTMLEPPTHLCGWSQQKEVPVVVAATHLGGATIVPYLTHHTATVHVTVLYSVFCVCVCVGGGGGGGGGGGYELSSQLKVHS